LTFAPSNVVKHFEVRKQPLVYLVPRVANPMTTGLLTQKKRENGLNCSFGGHIQNFKYGYMKPENG
jgi:hypothetical protein